VEGRGGEGRDGRGRSPPLIHRIEDINAPPFRGSSSGTRPANPTTVTVTSRRFLQVFQGTGNDLITSGATDCVLASCEVVMRCGVVWCGVVWCTARQRQEHTSAYWCGSML
jgi:hypothetical protein